MTDEMKFETAMAKLEEIVEKLESGELSLEESLSAFEEGIKLSKICAKILNDAERKVEILMKSNDGQLIAKPYDEDLSEDE
ncbi:TPA: exodeoxyribonuclease VII small subunit [Candidatus Poribacteria bacterium]|nr:exodeoxyribonuclease VII small subunit [Candidatus Poribacteria bacterium]